MTYVSSLGGNQYQSTGPQPITTTANLTPVKLTTTGFAYTSTGRFLLLSLSLYDYYYYYYYYYYE